MEEDLYDEFGNYIGPDIGVGAGDDSDKGSSSPRGSDDEEDGAASAD
jgi:hypothetical protein